MASATCTAAGPQAAAITTQTLSRTCTQPPAGPAPCQACWAMCAPLHSPLRARRNCCPRPCSATSLADVPVPAGLAAGLSVAVGAAEDILVTKVAHCRRWVCACPTWAGSTTRRPLESTAGKPSNGYDVILTTLLDPQGVDTTIHLVTAILQPTSQANGSSRELEVADVIYCHCRRTRTRS